MGLKENNWTIPNLLTFVRILLAPAVVLALIQRRVDAALWLFFAAGLTDALDGLSARLLKQRTALGAMLDPLADKVLIAASILSLGILEWVPAWLTVLVIARDLIIVGGLVLVNLWGVDVRGQIRPSFASKVNTTAQIVLILLVLVGHQGWEAPARFMPWLVSGGLMTALVWGTAALTIITGVDYVMHGLALIPPADE